MPARAPASIDMLQTVIRSSMDTLRITSPVYSMTYPVAPAVPIRPMMARMMSLAVTPGRSVPLTRISIVWALAGAGVWVARTCSTSLVPIPKASAPKAPWVRGVAVAADNGFAGQGQAQFRADHVDDALVRAVQIVERDAEFRADSGQRLHLFGGNRVGDRQGAVGRRHVVVHRRDGQIGPPHFAARHPQAVEGLGRSHLVDEVQVDVQNGRLSLFLVDDVAIPDFSTMSAVSCSPHLAFSFFRRSIAV